MRCYWGNGLLRKRRDKVEGGGPWKGWYQQCGTEVRRIDGGGGKYLLGQVGGIGNDEGWFLFL